MNTLRRICVVVFILTVLLGVFFDMVSKQWALSALTAGSVFVFGHIIALQLVFNNASFGILPLGGLSILFSCTAFLFLMYGVWYYLNKHRYFWQYFFGTGLVCAGAISNIIDRIRYGSVIDWIALNGFSVFNLADVMIGLGLIIVFLLLMRK